jgi:DNA-binding transcriptional MerR regulator
MPLSRSGLTLYRIGEALHEAGVSRATYFRWVREQRVSDTQYRDRNGRRLFTESELDALTTFAQQLQRRPVQQRIPISAE